MDKSEDLELEEHSKLEAKPGEDEDFEEILVDLGGFGKYQKRLFCLFTPFLFMTIPLLQNQQVIGFWGCINKAGDIWPPYSLNNTFCRSKKNWLLDDISGRWQLFQLPGKFWLSGVRAAQPKAQMLAWGQASHLSGDEPQQRRVGPDLLENRQLVGNWRVHLQVLRLHQGAGGADQDNGSEESFILGRSFKRTGYLTFSHRWLNLVEKQRLQMEAVELACTDWEYDKSELKMETLVAENNWVCQKAPLVQELYFLGNIGLILGIFVFRLPSLKDDFLLSSPYSLVVYHYLLQFGCRHLWAQDMFLHCTPLYSSLHTAPDPIQLLLQSLCSLWGETNYIVN